MTASTVPPAAASCPATVAEYERELAARLRGPARLRRSFVRETRDGLDDAVAALHAAGSPAADAERTAIAEFGPVRAVAAAFQDELAIAQSRRAAVLAMIAFPLLGLAWSGAWRGAPGEDFRSGAVSGLAWLLDTTGLVTAVVAVLGVLALTRGGRPAGRWVAALVLAAVATTVGFSIALGVLNPDGMAWLLTRPAGVAVSLVTLVSVGWISAAAAAAIRCARPARA